MSSGSARDRIAQQFPDGRVDASFPSVRLGPDVTVVRAHSADRGPWFFENKRLGRFSLEGERGTCYAADDVMTALRERLGEMFLASNQVSFSDAQAAAVSVIRVPHDTCMANIAVADAAGFGVTRELSAGAPYDVSQAWADRFDGLAFDGIRYSSRFTTDPGPNSWAIFGEGGSAPDWPVDEVRRGDEVCERLGIQLYFDGGVPRPDELVMEQTLPPKAGKRRPRG